MNKISIIVPVYNEAETIEKFIINLKKEMQKMKVLSECIVVNDNSTDTTLNILKRSDITFFSHSRHLGYGAALKTGISKTDGDIVCIIDGDNTYSPGDIHQLIQFIDKYDMAVGARIEYGTRYIPVYQKLAKGFICSLLGGIFQQKILDINSGMRLMKRAVVKKYVSVLSNGFSFTAGITLAMLLGNYKIKYVPISYSERAGKSKVKVFSYTINFIRSYWRIVRFFMLNSK